MFSSPENIYAEKIQSNLEILKLVDPTAVIQYQNIEAADPQLAFAPGDPEPANLVFQGALFYPGYAKQYAEEYVSFHLANIQPYIMPNFLFARDDPIAFKHCMAIDDDLGLDIIKHPIAKHPRDTRFCPTVFVFGLGLAYSLERLLDELDVCNVIAVEIFPQLISAFLATANIDKISAKLAARGGTLRFVFQTDALTALRMVIDRAKLLSEAHLNYFQPFVCHRLPGMDKVVEHFGKNAPHMFSQSGYFNDECRQTLQTYKNLTQAHGLLCNQHPVIDDATAVIVGSGPSLDKTWQSIKALSDKCFIIACGTAMAPLLKKGIVPDAYVELETAPIISDYMAHVANSTSPDDFLFFGASGIPQVVAQKWRHNYLFLRDMSTSTQFLPQKYQPIRQTWPIVGNAGLGIAIALGFRRIVLTGLDCGKRRNERHHSELSAYYDGTEQKIEAVNPNTNIDYATEETRKAASDIDNLSWFELPSVLGDSVWATAILRTSHQYIEYCIRETANVQVWQVSEGAKINLATNIAPDAFDPNIFPANPPNIRDMILSRIDPVRNLHHGYKARFADAAKRSDSLIAALKADFNLPIYSLMDWIRAVGIARLTFLSFYKPGQPEFGFFEGTLHTVAKAIAERGMMISDVAQRAQFLKAGARAMSGILDDMVQHLHDLVRQMDEYRGEAL